MSVAVAVVPSYQPDATAILELIDVLRGSRIPVLVADDASADRFDPVLADAVAHGATLVRHEHNAGIARSLNAGLSFACENGATWLLTADQDSTLEADYVERMLLAADTAVAVIGGHSVGAVAAARIDDASGYLKYPTKHIAGLPVTAEVIQSGTLWSVPAMVAIGGFDESFGIDAVDAAACVRLRAAGRRIVLAEDVVLGHRVGDGRQVRVLGRTVMASGHPAARRTTIVRNRLRLAPEEFTQSPVHAFRTLRRVAMSTLLAVMIEEDRWAKAKASARGVLPRGRHR